MQVRKRKYSYFDFLRIPFACAPISSALRVILLVMGAMQPSVQVIATALFVDNAIAIFNGQLARDAIYLPLWISMAIIAYVSIQGSINDFVDQKLKIGIAENFRANIVDKRAKLEYRHIEDNDTWELIKRVCSDPVGRVSGGFGNIMQAASLIITVVSLLSIITVQVWWAGFAIIAFSVPMFYIAYKSGKNSYEANKEAQKHNRRADYLQGLLTGRENVEERALFSYTNDLSEKWYDKYEAARKINVKVQARNFIKMKGGGIITLFVSVGIIAILILPLQRGEISVGMFIGLVTATFNLVQNISWSLVWITSQIAENREYLKDITAFSELSEQKGALEFPHRAKGFVFRSLEFVNVSFAYPGTERLILDDFNLKIYNGMHYAFVGENGAGKTTITKLLCGMYSNYEGEILINGKNLRDYAKGELKGIFSVVYQDFAKYYIKLKDNVELGDVCTDDAARMRGALATMKLDDLVRGFPNGVDTYLGKIKENGTDVSGGQWQRIAIARSLYSNALVRILDEPTAALDPIAESSVYDMFGQISKGQTTIFITHRLGAARLADEIVVLSGGKAVEKGSHAELMSINGIYAEMFDAQRSWYQ